MRWTELDDETQIRAGDGKAVAQSEWLTFTVLKSTPRQQEAWLKNLLADAPLDDGVLAGDFLPSLVAAAPDPRALDTLVTYLYADNLVVSRIAASALEVFPQPEVLRAVVATLVEHGPSAELAEFATEHTGWTADDEKRIVRAAIPYLQLRGITLPSGKQAPPLASTQTSAALTLLRNIFYSANHRWPSNPELAAYANAQVLQAAPNIMANANMTAVHELSLSLAAMPFSPRVHELLLQIAERPDDAGDQALLALAWRPQPGDLPYLGGVLTAPGYRGNRGSLPYALARGYGDAAFPYLEDAVANSPDAGVRAQSAEELALRNRSVGFQFLLDQLVQAPSPANRSYRRQLFQWTKQCFGKELPSDANEQQVVTFLRSKIPSGL